MRRSKPSIGGKTTSASAPSAIAIRCRARAAHVFTSPVACASGLPIIRVMSAAIASALASIAAIARSRREARCRERSVSPGARRVARTIERRVTQRRPRAGRRTRARR